MLLITNLEFIAFIYEIILVKISCIYCNCNLIKDDFVDYKKGSILISRREATWGTSNLLKTSG